MSFQIDGLTLKWLVSLQVLGQGDFRQVATSNYEVKQHVAPLFENGIKPAGIVESIYKKVGLPVPKALQQLKVQNTPATLLYNWNVINQALKKVDKEIDPQTKNMIVNGDREHLVYMLRQMYQWHMEINDDCEDSLETEEFKRKTKRPPSQQMKESLSLSRSQQPPAMVPLSVKASEVERMRKVETPIKNASITEDVSGDLLEYVLAELMSCIGLKRNQAIALLSDNCNYLAHVVVKGVKGEFSPIQKLMENWFQKVDFIVQKMMEQNDMCFFFLQVIKPSLLSRSEEIAQWGCRILSRIAHQLANRDMLPLAYDWFVREAGGLATTVLALGRHPKLNQHVVGYILEFARFNVAELFTVQLRKITSTDHLSYIKFILLIFDPLADSKLSSEELLSSGAIDYWVQSALKWSDNAPENTIEMRLYSIEFLTKLWRAYPFHIQETLDKVNDIMTYIKRGIRETSQIMRYTLLQLLFNLLDEFASKKNPYASIVYKKLTFLFIENHEETNVREFMLHNFTYIIRKYRSIPIDIFLEPFVKQIKIRESKSYILNIFDMDFINIVVGHPKLKGEVALELFDLLAKTKLNNYEFAIFADQAMEDLLDRFLGEEVFLEYTAKLVKISLAIFYSTFKHKKGDRIMGEQERMHAQKRAEIVNFIISLVERGSPQLNENIKEFVVHLKVQIQNKLGTTHRGIEKILSMFPNVERALDEAMQAALQKEEVQSNMTSQNSRDGFKFPKLEQKYLSKDRDQVASQQSSMSQGTRYSRGSRAQFPQKDYTRFAEEDEKRFLKEHGIGFKKKNIRTTRRVVQQQVDPRVQEQLVKAKLRKEQEQKRKAEEREKIERRKEQLKVKIQKQLKQRELATGVRGVEKDVQVKMVFEDGEINENLIEDDEIGRLGSFQEEQNRDYESVKLNLKKYNGFLRKIFGKYSSSRVNKKDFFEEESDSMAQVDLLRLCKEKNLQKNKQTIVELLKKVNDRNIKSCTFDGFQKFLEALIVHTCLRDRVSTHQPMGHYLYNTLRKMSVGQNFKLQEDQDENTKNLTQKVRYNPHVELPQNYRKVYERVYEPFRQCSFPTQKAIKNQSMTTCYEVVNQMLYDIFKFHLMQEEVRFFEQAKVVKKHTVLPPRPVKKEREEAPISLLQDRQSVPIKKRAASNFNRTPSNRINATHTSMERQKQNSKPKSKIMNAAQKKKQEEEEAKRSRKEKEQEEFKRRQAQVKKRMEKMQEEKQRQKQRKQDQKNAERQQQEQKRKKQKEDKERYQKDQKDKLQRYKREKEDKEKQEKQRQKQQRQKQDEQRKDKMKVQMSRQEQKRKEDAQKKQRQRELSEDNKRKKKQEEEKKKQMLKKQVLKKLQGQKQRFEIQKLMKQLLKKIFSQGDIQGIFESHKDELKSMFSYGKQYNEYKLGGTTQDTLEQKGWITLCQQFGLCDVKTANSLIKQNQKEKGRAGFTYQDFQETLLGLGVGKQIEQELDDYEKAHKASATRLEKYIRTLKIPKDKQTMKEYFVGLKNSLKKKEEIQVTAPNGEKQTWQMEQ